MANRITGLNSGLDTETLVTSLVSSYQKKVDTLQGNQKRHSWKQDAWKTLNKKAVGFYNGKISSMTMTSDFMKKVTTSTNSSAVTILTSDKAMNATQSLSITKTAKSAFATGAKLARSDDNDKTAIKGSTKLSELKNMPANNTWTSEEPVYETVPKKDAEGNIIYKKGPDGEDVFQTDAEGNFIFDSNGQKIKEYETEQKQVFDTVPVLDENGQPVMVDDGNGNQVPKTQQVPQMQTVTHTGYSFEITVGTGENAKTQTIGFDANATINDVVNKLKGLEVNGQKFNANFDENQGRIYMAAANTGEAGTFSFSGNDALVGALGFKTGAENAYKGEDAEIILNGQDYKSASGTFEINGLTLTANEVAENITITTKQDTSGIYDMVKSMLKEYNDLIKEMDTNYYADPARKYQMLTEDEKDAMSEKEVEEWEKHIKDGLLAKDNTLYEVIQSLKSVMSKGYEVGGKTMYLSDFGIATGSYLSTDQNERGVYHIDGDKDDLLTGTNEDKLTAMIASDPETVAGFFSQLAQGLRSSLFDKMKTTEFSSSFTLYEDKLMASQYSDYNSKITDATDRLNKKQDSYYAKFTRMETAMAKINAVQSNVSSYFG